MHFFDAHCDTVMRTFDGEFDFVAGRGRAHLDLPRLLAAGGRVQLFAVFAPASYYPDRDLRGHAEEAIRRIRGWADASDGRMRVALTAMDVRAPLPPCSPAPVHALIGLEGADPLAGRAENLEQFYRLGVRNVIPAWDDNPFSGTVFGLGSGLTPEGYKLIELCEALRVMVDVSHLSDTAFGQVCDMARRPFIASHSNCRALCPSQRNLTDEQIRALADRGGVMGVNLSPDFLAPDYHAAWGAVMAQVGASYQGVDAATRQKIREAAGPRWAAIPLPGIEWIARHVQHAIAVGGEECIGLGGDLDGISFLPAGVTGVESYPRIAESLLAAGLTAAQVEKVCWGNMARVFGDVLEAG
ncbi:MAG: membrane dipeptidase [Chloroflexi bacterium]|nr:membrane dipeptidase [Chloroflexota bacterium]